MFAPVFSKDYMFGLGKNKLEHSDIRKQAQFKSIKTDSHRARTPKRK